MRCDLPISVGATQHAQTDRDKAEADTRMLASKRASAQWAVARAMMPTLFPDALFGQLHLQAEARNWRDGDEKDEPPAHIGD